MRAFSLILVFLALSVASSAELPNPLVFEDGRRVESSEEWAERRAEIIESILSIQYGHMPGPPSATPVFVQSESDSSDEFLKQAGTLNVDPANDLNVAFHLYTPRSEADLFPVVIRFGIDPAMAEIFTGNGYAYACFEHRDLEPDTEGYDENGPAQLAYPEHDWASIAVWAWGAMRVLDYLETLPEIDAAKAVITGHSRMGKTALLTGAIDTRFKIVVPNGSGCGGAGLYRDPPRGVETLKLITLEKRFKGWFHEDLGKYADREDELPFDQHFMRAIVAPRVVLNTDALGDKWANPLGTMRAWEAAQPVFELLGVPENNLCHFREGGHDQLPADLDVLIDAANWHFRGTPLKSDFSLRPVAE